MRSLHAIKWVEYQKLESFEARNNFFVSTGLPFVDTLHAHGVGGGRQVLRFPLNKMIIQKIIGDVFFHPEDVDSVTQKRALSIFKVLSDDDDADQSESAGRDQYIVEVETARLIALCDSFSSVSGKSQVIRNESGIAEHGSSFDISISNYVRIVCAVSLQKLEELMQKFWACSIGLDCSTHRGRSYVNVQGFLFREGLLRNYHLLAIPCLTDTHVIISRIHIYSASSSMLCSRAGKSL